MDDSIDRSRSTIASPAERAGSLRPLRRAQAAEAVALAILAAVGGAAAVAGAQPVTAGVLFVAGAAIAIRRPALVAPYVAVLLPVGFSITVIKGVEVPQLHAAVFGAAAGHLARLGWNRREAELRPADWVFAAFVFGVALSGAGPGPRTVWLHNLALWGSLGVVFQCCSRVLANRAARRLLYLALAVAAVVEAVYAIVQYVSAAHGRFTRLGGAIVYPQPQATLEHPNALGAFLVLATLVLAGVALSERGRRRLLWFGGVAVAALGTVAPFSRGAWISLAAGAVALVIADRRHRRALGGTLAGLGLAAVAVAVLDGGALGARLSSIANGGASSLYGFRATLAHRAVDVIAAHPLTGAGRFSEVGTYAGRPTLATHPHDLLLGVGVFFGLPAALAFAALLVLAFRGAWRACRTRGASAVEASGVVAALVALVVNGLFEYPFWNTTWTVEIALLLMLAVGLGRAGPTPRAAS
ncbi:MAG: O-antigen ligase family protein [Actinomycetota bacterium]